MATIRRRGKTWQAQVRRAGKPPTSKSFQSKFEAQLWAAETELGMQSLSCNAGSAEANPTIASLLERYASDVTPSKKGADRELLKIRVICRQPIAKVTFGSVTGSHLARYRDARLMSVTPSTVRRELALLRHCLNVARREWGLPDLPSPFKHFRMPKQARNRTRRLTAEEQASLKRAIDKSKAPYLPIIVSLALETAMRRGELLSLRWSSIDLARRIVSLADTKNGDKRIVPLSPAAISIIHHIRSEGDRMLPIKPGTISFAWKAAVRRAGISDFRFHDLRHEAISRFFEQGLSVPEVALISGHKDVRMLFRYTHLRAEDVAKKLAGTMSNGVKTDV